MKTVLRSSFNGSPRLPADGLDYRSCPRPLQVAISKRTLLVTPHKSS